MNSLLAAILVSAVIVLGFQVIVPFPFGMIFGIAFAVIIVWYTLKKSTNPFSLPTCKRADPQNEDEGKQNHKAYRILKKRFLNGEITKEEFDRLREPFGDCNKMKVICKIIGVFALAFGLVNILWYAPYSLTLVFQNQPFPFEHLTNVEIHEGGGIGIQIGYMPFNEVMFDPYWLVWSLSLYSGIIILSILAVQSLRQNRIRSE